MVACRFAAFSPCKLCACTKDLSRACVPDPPLK